MGWRCLESATPCTVVILVKGPEAVLSPCPGPIPQCRVQSLLSTSDASDVCACACVCAYMYVYAHMTELACEKQNAECHSHLKTAAKLKWYSKQRGSSHGVEFSRKTVAPNAIYGGSKLTLLQ